MPHNLWGRWARCGPARSYQLSQVQILPAIYIYIFGIFNDPFPSIGEATRTKLPAGEKPAIEGHSIKKRGPPGYRMQYGKRYERRRESPEKLNFDKMEFSYTS